MCSLWGKQIMPDIANLTTAFYGEAQEHLFLSTLQYLMPEDVRGLYVQESNPYIKSCLRQDELWQRLRECFFPAVQALKKIGQDDYDLFWEIYEKELGDIPHSYRRLFSLAKAGEVKQLIGMLNKGEVPLEAFTYLDGNYLPFDYYVRNDKEFTTVGFAYICSQRMKLGLAPQRADSTGQELIHWVVRFGAPLPILDKCLRLYSNDNSEPAINYTRKVSKQRLEMVKPRIYPEHTTYFVTPFYLALLFERGQAVKAFITAHDGGQYQIKATIVPNPLPVSLGMFDTYGSSHLGNALRFNHQHVVDRLLETTLPTVFSEEIYVGIGNITRGLNPIAIALEFKRHSSLKPLLPHYRNIGHQALLLAIKSHDEETLILLLPYVSNKNLDRALRCLRITERSFINPITNPIIKALLDYYISFFGNDLMTIFKNLSSELKITSSNSWFSLFNQRTDPLTEFQLNQSAAINRLLRQCQHAKENLTTPFVPSISDIGPLITTIPHFSQFLAAFQTYLCKLRKHYELPLHPVSNNDVDMELIGPNNRMQ